ncbi:MAG: serine/threonine-protein kinase [Polyangiaceae bacterium]
MREGDVLEGRFRLDAVAGSGAMGVVFRGTDLARGAPVAVKVLRQADPTDIARFVREAEVLVALQHPNVVRYVAHGRTTANEPFLVMEWLAGETLKDRLARGPLSTLESVDVGLALASALAGAPASGGGPRDVKPANVMLVGGSVRMVKLLDFGVAALRRRQTLTEAGAIVGTPAYMSPEQARGEEVDARSDVFSLGALLFHCLAGERPFQGDDVLAIVLRIVRERAPAVSTRAPSAPVVLTQLVDAMLEPASERRPAIALIATELTRVRAAQDPSLTVSHVVPVLAKATLVHGAGAYALDGPVATVTQLHANPPVAPSAPSSPAGPGFYGAPAVMPVAAPASKSWLILGGALSAAAILIVGAVLLFLSLGARSSSNHSSRSSTSARPSATATVSSVPTSVAADQPGGSASGSVPAPPRRPCSEAATLCEPMPFDLDKVDPDAFIALCLTTVKRVDASMKLAVASFKLRGDRIAASDDGHSAALCSFDGAGRPDYVIATASGYLFGTRTSSPTAKKIGAAPDERCSFGSAYAKIRALGVRPTSVDLSLLADYVVWIFKDASNVETTLSAKSCEAPAKASPMSTDKDRFGGFL